MAQALSSPEHMNRFNNDGLQRLRAISWLPYCSGHVIVLDHQCAYSSDYFYVPYHFSCDIASQSHQAIPVLLLLKNASFSCPSVILFFENRVIISIIILKILLLTVTEPPSVADQVRGSPSVGS
jgi:hypothetical protein